MSLVIVYQEETYQLWCCDGLTIEARANGGPQKHQTVCKITKHPWLHILYGWSGDRYDASVITEIIKQESANSKSAFLESIATTCKRVNVLSQNYSLQANETYSRTGFVAGGYFDSEGFLAIVTPAGEVFEMEKYGAIGYAADIVNELLHPRAQDLLTLPEAFELMVEYFVKASRETQFVNRMVFPFVVAPHLFEDLSRFTILHRNSYKEITSAHRREIRKIAKSLESSTHFI